ncbi:MAG: TldD/PmbA family protein [Chloroflexota bacterium]|nr:TldD/PmbA family protein [Chloroflexota bacterium]
MDLLSTLQKRTEQAEVYTIERESTTVSFEANEMKTATTEETQGVALRGVVDGKLGFTAASGQAEVSELVANLLASARYGDEVPIVFPEKTPGAEVETYDPALAQIPMARFVEIGREVVDALRSVDADAKVDVDVERSVGRFTLRNSAGNELSQQLSRFSVQMSLERVRGDDVLMVYDSVHDISLTEDYRQALERLREKVERAKRPARLGSGRMPVLFSPVGAMVLALPIMLAVDGENVQRGVSPLSDRRGEQVFDPKITLWDDPTLPGRPSSGGHDREGVPCRRKALLADGVSEGFLYDLKTAALMDTESTGNGSRSLFSPPSPSPSNLVLGEGTTPLADILGDVERGLLVDHVLGVGQGNPMSGAFSNTLGLAYVIEGGEVVGRVKNVSIAGNIYEDLREVAALSEESYWVYGQIRLPYILLPGLNVVSQG